MKYIYIDNRTNRERKILDAALKNTWTVSDVFKNEEDFVSTYRSENQRLEWAPILVALAFGENTAFHGFGERIAQADDISVKTWLSTHLLDESKHTEGFSKLLNYLYPSYKYNQDKLFSSRDALLFYGYTHRCNSLLEWLACTQIAEVFGRQCYKALHAGLKEEPIVEVFLKNIISDEARHIAYIAEIINAKRKEMNSTIWIKNINPFIEKMTKLGRNMFEANKKGSNYRALSSLGIDVTKFCEVAESEIINKYII